jgi:starch-binding outer membrane protein, SusD/RagB family
MKKTFLYMLIFLFSTTFTACSDFFNPDTDDELNGDDYISSQTEMYTGFLGIMTKLQAIGDKEILLTDTRGDLLEPTDQSTSELISLYDYDDNLKGNSYADPAGYYEVIIACNDYLSKMTEFKKNYPQLIDDEVYKALISSTVRIKVWTYKTIGEIYGQAVWFDDPVTKVEDITSSSKYQLLEMDALIDKCLNLMDNGYNGIASNISINWIAWLDPNNVTSIASSAYRKWNYMIPPYAGVYSELCLWKGAALNSKGQDATSYYKTAADDLLTALNEYVSNESYAGSGYWLPTAYTPGRYSAYWDRTEPYANECVAALLYDYTNNQANTLLKHFSTEYPNEYLLRPSETGRLRFYDTSFNPGVGTTDTRGNLVCKQDGTKYYIGKFRAIGSTYRAYPYQDDVHIYLYRATQYHIMLAEALNNLGRYNAMDAVLNSGVSVSNYVASDAEWTGFTKDWTATASWGTRRYPSMGIRGCFGLSARSVKTSLGTESATAVRKYNDCAILDETMMEFAVEGKTYPTMIRIAKRYNDYNIIADRVTPKYTTASLKASVRSKILAGKYYVPWDLGITKSDSTVNTDK